MSWDHIIGHSEPLQRFKRCAARNRLASTYLFLGPNGIGKRSFALKLAEAILCETNSTESLEPCGVCSGCLQVQSQTHPDLLQVSKPLDKNILPLDLFVGRKTHRHREGLIYEIGMKPFRGGYRIAIIDDADYFNIESANCLLKTLEEPPPSSILILLGTSQQRQLHTIVSRSQLVRFNPLTPPDLLETLRQTECIDIENQDVVSLEELSIISSGSVQRAISLSEPGTFEFRKQLLTQLASGDPHASNFSKAVVEYSESLGKEGYRRRPRLDLVGELSIEFFRNAYLAMTGANSTPLDALTETLVSRVASAYADDPLSGAVRLSNCIDRTGDMQFHLTTNAQAINVIGSWLVDVGRLMRGESVRTGEALQGLA